MAAPSSVANRCVPGKPYRHTRARSRHESRPPSASFEHACATQLLEMSHAFLAQGHSSEKLWVHRDGRRYCLPRLARDLCDKKPHESDQPSEWDVSVQAVVCAWPRMSGEALLPGRPSPWDTGDGVMFVGWPGKVQGPGVMPLEWDLRWFEPGQFSHALELTTPQTRRIYILSLSLRGNITLHHMALASEVVRRALVSPETSLNTPIDVVYAFMRGFSAERWLPARLIRESLLRHWDVLNDGHASFDAHLRHQRWDVIGFAMRCMAVVPELRNPRQNLDGFLCARSVGSLPVPDRLSPTSYLREARFSLLMVRRLEEAAGVNNRQHISTSNCLILSLNDMPTDSGHSLPHDAPKLAEWDLAHGSAYLGILQEALQQWARHWQRVLDEIDDAMRSNINDILSKEKRLGLMFDTSFKRVDLYFTVIELLRHSGDWVEETKADMETLIVQIERWDRCKLKTQSEPQSLKDSVRAVADDLKRRIKTKRDEVMSLRDGLVDGTSLREASKSTTMNRYVMVFTIVTVLFLPPSFTATVWGMDSVQGPEPHKTLLQWGSVTIILSLVTYTAAVLLLAIVARESLYIWLSEFIATFDVHLGRFKVRALKMRPPHLTEEEALTQTEGADASGMGIPMDPLRQRGLGGLGGTSKV